jgi:uncharacterized protein YkwD
MKVVLLAAIALLTTSFIRPTAPELNPEEQKLYDLFSAYRKQKGLPVIPLSPALTQVAQLHVYDLHTNQPVTERCNLHSWSNKGKWTPCCYTGNNASAECMWRKPLEIAGYTGSGFEIAAYATNMSAVVALRGWQESSGHNEVMINKGSWSHLKWNAVGVGIMGDYAVIWFGTIEDK